MFVLYRRELEKLILTIRFNLGEKKVSIFNLFLISLMRCNYSGIGLKNLKIISKLKGKLN